MNEVDLVTIRSMIIVNSAHIEYEKAAVSRTLVKFISVTKKKRALSNKLKIRILIQNNML